MGILVRDAPRATSKHENSPLLRVANSVCLAFISLADKKPPSRSPTRFNMHIQERPTIYNPPASLYPRQKPSRF